MKSLINTVLYLLLTLSVTSLYADNKADPTQPGPYQIGHTTMVMTDPSRNPDGTPGTSGRPLYMHIWYPSNGGIAPLTHYNQNSPLYDGTHPGFGLIHFSIDLLTTFGTKDNIPLAHGKFPLIIYSHGSNGLPIIGNRFQNELLASYGFIVVAMEHTGNSTNSAAARFLGLPTPRLIGTQNTLTQRSLDVRFVITQMLNQTADPQFSQAIDANKIGLYGYSLGGGTTMMTVAGSQSAGLTPDTRIKAAIPMDGTDFTGLTPSDYANATIPILLFADANDVNRFAFPQLVNSHPKYYADTSAALHIPQADPFICDIVHQDLLAMNANPNPIPESVILENTINAFGVYTIDEYAECDKSIFNGISSSTITAAVNGAGGNPAEVDQLKPLMPLRKQVSLAEMDRLSRWYVVSFFNKVLKEDNNFEPFLSDKLNQKSNPLVDFAKDCRQDPSSLLSLNNGSKITFTPVGNNYKVSYSTGNILLDKGTNNLNLGDDDQASIALPFSFKMFKGKSINQIVVGSNGYIIAPTSDLSNLKSMPPVYSDGSPWVQAGELQLNGLNTISPLMNDLNPSESGGVYAKVEPNRVIVTYDAVPIYTGAGGGATNTMQVIINANGTIEMVYGNMGNSGPDYQPGWIGGAGIASEKATADDLKQGLIDYASLTKPKTMTSNGIYETFYVGAGSMPCH
ncbi:MAG: hypothetical protein JSR17_13945 [Proteobacteria bacterium]|nr:hypothetical protein [Pseudomonadota bacterium]